MRKTGAKTKVEPAETQPPKRKPTKKERDEHFAAHIPGVLAFHATMLADGLRNKLLIRAIKESVKPSTSFLDIGAGSGVWAILAAKLGARRVVAVEIEECLIPVIHKHAQENGVADRIEIIHGNSNDVKLKGRFDVIVSELFGDDALGAETVKAFINIRTRFLAPGGTLIPQKLAMIAAPVHFDNTAGRIPSGLPLETNFLQSLRLNYGRSLSITDRRRVKLLAPAKTLVEIDFRSVAEAPPMENLTASWDLKDLRRANAIATFNHSTFTEKITMDAFGSRSWGFVIHEFVPFEASAGKLVYRARLDAKQGSWTVAVQGEPTLKPQAFGPVFAFTRMRLTQRTTPHRRCLPRKVE